MRFRGQLLKVLAPKIWKSLTTTQKELLIAGIHGSAVTLDLLGMKTKGVPLREAVKSYPFIFLVGTLIGYGYYRLVSKLIERGE